MVKTGNRKKGREEKRETEMGKKEEEGSGKKANGVATMGGGAPGYFHLDGKDSLIGNGIVNASGKVD